MFHAYPLKRKCNSLGYVSRRLFVSRTQVLIFTVIWFIYGDAFFVYDPESWWEISRLGEVPTVSQLPSWDWRRNYVSDWCFTHESDFSRKSFGQVHHNHKEVIYRQHGYSNTWFKAALKSPMSVCYTILKTIFEESESHSEVYITKKNASNGVFYGPLNKTQFQMVV